MTEKELTDLLNCVRKIINFLEKNDCAHSMTEWRDSDGFGFNTDMGYFVDDGLCQLEEYLVNNIEKHKGED